jgi:hypothetical protein
MTARRSQMLRAFVRGESIARIAERCGVSYAQAWSQLRRAVAELDRKNPSALDAVRWQNYLMLMRIVDQAVAAFEKSAEDGVSEIASQTIERPDDCGKVRLTGKNDTHHVRKDAGDVRFLEVAMKALREIRDLFGIGAEAQSKLKATAPEHGLALGALVRTGAARLVTKWGPSPETAPQQPVELGPHSIVDESG